MKNNKILSTLINDAPSIYLSPEYEKSEEYRMEVAKTEEILLEILFQSNIVLRNESPRDVVSDEIMQSIMDQVEQLQNSQKLLIDQPSNNKDVFQNYIDTQTMISTDPVFQKEVPEALMAYVDRSLDFDEALSGKSTHISAPGFLVSIIDGGLQIIKSSLQGFKLKTVEAIPTRLNSSVATNEPGVVHLEQQGPAGNISIELNNEGNQRMGISLCLPEAVTGQAILKTIIGNDIEQTRIIDSFTLENELRISFSGLETGAYVVEILPHKQKVTFLIQGNG